MTLKELLNVLYYDPETGYMYWWKNHKRAGRKKPNKNGYYEVGYKGKLYQLHRLAFLYMTGRNPDKVIDHINRDKTDNRWCNLREVSRSENIFNQSRLGVYKQKTSNKWVAQIQVDGERTYLGSFEKKQDAVAARKAANEQYRKGIKHDDKCKQHTTHWW